MRVPSPTLRTPSSAHGAGRIADKMRRAAAGSSLELDAAQLHIVDVLAASAAAALRRRAPIGAAGPGAHARPGTADAGVYLWGPPGRGKSWLVSALHNALDTPLAMRVHFHEFFESLHARAHAAGAGVSSPRGSAIAQALDGLLGSVRILMFDEFHVHDPGDAMFIARAFRGLLERGITLVATSNYAPDDLLPNEYFHHLFEPTIDVVKSRLAVLELDAGVDYRTLDAPRATDGFAAGHILVPGTPGQLTGAGLAPPGPAERTDVTPTTHTFTALRVASGQVWFDFADLCDAPSATSDYLDVARTFGHVVLQGVPRPQGASPSAWQRFANLVDVLYDRDVRFDIIGRGKPDPAAATGHPVDAARLTSRLAALRSPDPA